MKISLRGLKLNLRWTHDGQGYSSHTSYSLASYHHPDSCTWRWALYWNRNRGWKPIAHYWTPNKGKTGSMGLTFPIIGGLFLSWQQHTVWPEHANVEPSEVADERRSD